MRIVVSPTLATVGTTSVDAAAKAAAIHTSPIAPDPALSGRARVTFPDLGATTRCVVRPNGKQQNLTSITPEAQAHIVVENYVAHAAKRLVSIGQLGGAVSAALWWSSATGDANQALRASEPRVAHNGALTGTSVLVKADVSGTVRFEAPILDSVRGVRDHAGGDFDHTSTAHGRVDSRTQVRQKAKAAGFAIADKALRTRLVSRGEGRLVFERESVQRTPSGAPSHMHRLIVEALPGTTLDVDEVLNISMSSAGRPQVRLSYVTDVPQLTPYTPLQLLTPKARAALEADMAAAQRGEITGHDLAELTKMVHALEDLASLVYHEKILAGLWRFPTYFGRDTMLLIHMLRPLLDPQVVDCAVQSVLERLSTPGQAIIQWVGEQHFERTSPGGEVAHEEAISDQAAHERLDFALKVNNKADSVDVHTIESAIFDYKMVDGDSMLMSLIADYLFSVDESKRQEFLGRINRSGKTNKAQLELLMGYLASRGRPYAESVSAGHPDPLKLVTLFPGVDVGDWRDSVNGLCLARIAGSVNQTAMPVALAKAAKVATALGLPNVELTAMADAWKDVRDRHFRVHLGQDELRARLGRFLTKVRRTDPIAENESERAAWAGHFANVEIESGVTIDDFVHKSVKLKGRFANGIDFYAIGLDGHGARIPVMTMDGGMGLLGADAQPEAVKGLCDALSAPYPLGLDMTQGKAITNAALAETEAQYDLMAPGGYHGQRVTWPWQEAETFVALLSQTAKLRSAGHDSLADLATRTARDVARVATAGGLETAELYGYKLGASGLEAAPLMGSANEYDAWPGNDPQGFSLALPIVLWAARKGLLE